MGWSISHGGTRYAYSSLSLGQLEEKLQKAKRYDRTALAPIFSRHSGDSFKIRPQQAEKIGQALHQAADSLKIWDRSWAGMARQIGDSALLAARLGEPWRWS